ncbi:MAG: hypothetical protein HQ534_12975 [Armatimonadetes bacterium]|nr:hypothetical protein [Armatimonadota bacterium]
MFQALADKILTGIVSFGMMVLTTTEGNNASFAEITSTLYGNRIVVKTELVDAFANDFEEIFRCGKEIEIFFNIKIKAGNQTIHTNVFKHIVVFDPLEQNFTVNLEEKNIEISTNSYEELIEIISQVEYEFADELNYEQLDVTLVSYLEEIYLDTLGKDYDMMMLWKFKKPKVNKRIDLGFDES